METLQQVRNLHQFHCFEELPLMFALCPTLRRPWVAIGRLFYACTYICVQQ